MSQRDVTLLSDVVLLTCVVETGKGEDVIKAARGVGAGGATIHSQRGVGIRERVGVLGIAIDAEKDVVSMLVGTDQAELVSSVIYNAIGLGRPGGGFLYLTPLESAATYVPQEIRDRLESTAS
ncbi:MAG: P-II family nitrogen regulator [Woeseiaceae bacterium]|nr:P-II family nitrogen regulator [Woeseiaceae bacterium]